MIHDRGRFKLRGQKEENTRDVHTEVMRAVDIRRMHIQSACVEGA